jgi:CDP-glycerol glycerophosphotransferase (TagB/SpsB family)
MVREFFIELYLMVFKIVFTLFKICPIRDKITFVVSFSQNSLFVYEELVKKAIPYEVVFLAKPSCIKDIKVNVEAPTYSFETTNLIHFLISIYHLATSKYIIIDNYYGFLSAVEFKQNVQCIQLWHAAGAIKTFGLRDQSIKHRTKRAKARFQKVYRKFDKVVVGSEALANIFMEAFGLPRENILRTGIPRTDIFYDKNKKSQVITKLIRDNPILSKKKVILYAPTYRDNQFNHFEMALDIDKIYNALHGDYILLLKLHPAIKVKTRLEGKYKGFVFDYSNYNDINHLLLVVDILISDYSSVPYEFAILNKPMIFYPYDLTEYIKDRGLWDDYEKLVPGPIVNSTDEIINCIKDNQFNLKKIEDFNRKWNLYSDGHSSQKLIESLFEESFSKVAREAL